MKAVGDRAKEQDGGWSKSALGKRKEGERQTWEGGGSVGGYVYWQRVTNESEPSISEWWMKRRVCGLGLLGGGLDGMGCVESEREKEAQEVVVMVVVVVVVVGWSRRRRRGVKLRGSCHQN